MKKPQLKGKAFKDKGVNYRETVRGNYLSRFWEGTYIDKHGIQVRKQFSVDLYGPRKAKWMAQKFRDSGVKGKKFH